MIIAQVFNIKWDNRLSEANYDRIVEWTRNILPEGNRLKENLYAAKSMMKPLGLGYQKIDMCPIFCMLYPIKNAELIEYRICGHSRYKLMTDRGRTLVTHRKLRYFQMTPRLHKLFMSPKTAEHMTWHQSYDAMNEVIVLPLVGETWKHFNSMHP